MEYGYAAPARVIYTIYSPLCHQLAFRSWFLYGEQTYFPRKLAHIPNVITYEELVDDQNVNLLDARKFVGNQQVGYKVAICQRDVAIYGSLLFFGVLFGITGRRIKIIPWYMWMILALGPIGVDGLSQLPGITKAILPAWIPVRESNPLLRTITGALFGFTTAWYIFPLIESSMRETRRVLARKMAVVMQESNSSDDRGDHV
jgi:uncharacterized membrane protein